METIGFTPYPPKFVEQYRKAGYWQDRTLGDVFDEACNRFSDRIALISKGEQITYRQVAKIAERLALHFLMLGLRPGENFVMQLPNVPEFIYVYLALLKIGVRPIMALPAHRLTEISHFVELSQAVGYAAPSYQGILMAQTLQHSYPHLRRVFILGQALLPGQISLSSLLYEESGLAPERLRDCTPDPLSPALFLLSGGTTGVPKLIPRTHTDYLYNTRISATLNDFRSGDKRLIALPMAHNLPLACPGVQGSLMYGGCAILSPSTYTQDICTLIEQYRVTHLEFVVPILIRLLNDPNIKNYDLSSLRVINGGGQKTQPEIKRRIEKLLPSCKVQECFGMAEGLLCMARLDDPDEIRHETVGRPASPGDEIRLVDEEGNEVAEGEVGELLVRGPYTLRGYFRTPEYNTQAFTPDGFYKTGDLVRRHPSGNYIIEGRKKDLINRGGEKISAEEIENLLLSHPSIINVACVPIPDPILGERMCACVIPRPGQMLTLEDLSSFLSEKGIAKFKFPERIELVESFPLTQFGKVSKAALAKQVGLLRKADSV